MSTRILEDVLIEGQRGPQHAEDVEWRRDLSDRLAVDNSERLLQPGMTATAEITVTQVADAVARPECRPEIHAAGRAAGARGRRASPAATPAGSRRDATARSKTASRACGGCLVTGVEPVPLELGPTDGRVTVMRSGDLIAWRGGDRRCREQN